MAVFKIYMRKLFNENMRNLFNEPNYTDSKFFQE